MPKIVHRRLTMIFLVLISVTILIIRSWPDHRIHLIMCDVGQGDAFLVTVGFTQVLVDTGKDETVLRCLNQHLPWWDRQLELLIITHDDADHSGGVSTIRDWYQVNLTLAPANFCQKQSSACFEPKVGECILPHHRLEWCKLSPDTTEAILSVAGTQKASTVTDNNDESMAFFAKLDKVRTTWLADIPSARELALLNAGLISQTDILKVAHHGAKTSTNNEVVMKMLPEISLISVGKNNRYGHPSPMVLENLQKIGSQIYRTDQFGAVEILIEDDQFWLAK